MKNIISLKFYLICPLWRKSHDLVGFESSLPLYAKFFPLLSGENASEFQLIYGNKHMPLSPKFIIHKSPSGSGPMMRRAKAPCSKSLRNGSDTIFGFSSMSVQVRRPVEK